MYGITASHRQEVRVLRRALAAVREDQRGAAKQAHLAWAGEVPVQRTEDQLGCVRHNDALLAGRLSNLPAS